MRSVVFLSGDRLLITAKPLSQFHLLLHMLEIKEGSVTAEMRFAGTLQIGCNYFSENNAKICTFTLQFSAFSVKFCPKIYFTTKALVLYIKVDMCNEKLRPKRSGLYWFDTISKQFGWERVYLSNFGFSANIIGIKNCGCLNHKANLMSVKSGWSANRAKFCTQVVDSDNLEHLIALSPFRLASFCKIIKCNDRHDLG